MTWPEAQPEDQVTPPGDYLAAALTVGPVVQVTYWNAVTSATAIACVLASVNPKELVTGPKT